MKRFITAVTLASALLSSTAFAKDLDPPFNPNPYFTSAVILAGTTTSAFSATNFLAGTNLYFAGNGVSNVLQMDVAGNFSNTIMFRRAQTNAGALYRTASGNGLGALVFRGYTPSGWVGTKADITVYAGEDWTDTSTATYISMQTTPSGSTTRAERIRINSTGNILVAQITDDATNKLQITGSMTLSTGSVYKVNNVQVLGARITGWAAATGTPTRTTFVTSTVTLSLLAERVKALIDDLITHGVIGP